MRPSSPSISLHLPLSPFTSRYLPLSPSLSFYLPLSPSISLSSLTGGAHARLLSGGCGCRVRGSAPAELHPHRPHCRAPHRGGGGELRSGGRRRRRRRSAAWALLRGSMTAARAATGGVPWAGSRASSDGCGCCCRRPSPRHRCARSMIKVALLVLACVRPPVALWLLLLLGLLLIGASGLWSPTAPEKGSMACALVPAQRCRCHRHRRALVLALSGACPTLPLVTSPPLSIQVRAARAWCGAARRAALRTAGHGQDAAGACPRGRGRAQPARRRHPAARQARGRSLGARARVAL